MFFFPASYDRTVLGLHLQTAHILSNPSYNGNVGAVGEERGRAVIGRRRCHP